MLIKLNNKDKYKKTIDIEVIIEQDSIDIKNEDFFSSCYQELHKIDNFFSSKFILQNSRYMNAK